MRGPAYLSPYLVINSLSLSLVVEDLRTTAAMAPKWLKKNSLKNRDDQRTNAAELTLRQSIYPIILVTILFFLWVSDTALQVHNDGVLYSPLESAIAVLSPGCSRIQAHRTIASPYNPTKIFSNPD